MCGVADQKAAALAKAVSDTGGHLPGAGIDQFRPDVGSPGAAHNEFPASSLVEVFRALAVLWKILERQQPSSALAWGEARVEIGHKTGGEALPIDRRR